VGISFSTIALPLYMAALGFSAVTIGLSFVLMTLAGTALVFVWGVLGDRVGYKTVLVAVELLFGASCLLLAYGTSLSVIIVAAMMGGYGGQGGGGLRGSFGPGLSAFVGSVWKDAYERTRRIGAITFVGGIAGLAGYGVLAWVGARAPVVGDAAAYQDAYLLLFGTTVGSIAALLLTREGSHPPRTARILTSGGQRFIGRVVLSNVFNGFGLGLAIPLLPLWFSLRYGFDAGTIALVFGASTACSSVASYFSHAVATRLGNVATGAATRVVNGAMLVAMAAAPWGALAGGLYVVRGFSGGLGVPARTSVTLGGVAGSELGAATSISGVSMRASLMSSGIAGYLLTVAENAPLGAGGVFQLVGGLIYYRLLKGTPGTEGVKEGGGGEGG
jgi:Major Facilitator Superfamily